MVGFRTPTADGSDPGVTQALNARIERPKRYLILSSLPNQVEFIRKRPNQWRPLNAGSNLAGTAQQVDSNGLPQSLTAATELNQG